MASGFGSTSKSMSKFHRVNNFRGFTYGNNGPQGKTPAMPKRSRVSQ
jgi:hypothetical protein